MKENQRLTQCIDELCKASIEAYDCLKECLKNKVDLDNQSYASTDSPWVREVIHELTLRAQKGNASAMAFLGNAYLNGWSVETDAVKALRYAKLSASLGNPVGEVLLGYFYLHGHEGGVVKDYDRALYWFNMALDKGNSMAANNLGVMYEEGLGVKKDMNLALRYFKKAAAQNNSLAKKNLERLTKS